MTTSRRQQRTNAKVLIWTEIESFLSLEEFNPDDAEPFSFDEDAWADARDEIAEQVYRRILSLKPSDHCGGSES